MRTTVLEKMHASGFHTKSDTNTNHKYCEVAISPVVLLVVVEIDAVGVGEVVGIPNTTHRHDKHTCIYSPVVLLVVVVIAR